MNLKKYLLLLAFAAGVLAVPLRPAHAEDAQLALFYTGETHAMLYHCDCPLEPDGGVARRATLVKKLRAQYPRSLFLDSGNYLAAGLLDQQTQSVPLDKKRSEVYLQAMELMGYDALAISDDEFNFGKDYLEGLIGKSKLSFVSSNLKFKKALPFLVKEVGGIKVGIIALTSPAAQKKTPDSEFLDPKKALEEALAQLNKKGVNLVILLSNMGEPADLMTIVGIPGINILIDGHARGKADPVTKIGDLYVLRPAWQGRRLSKALINIKSGKLENVSVEEIRVSDKISEDVIISAVVPKCFADKQCRKAGSVGICQNAGAKNASCLFSEAKKINLKIITSKDCITCNTEGVVNYLKNQFPGLNVSYLYYPEGKAAKIIKDLKAEGLPIYLLGKEVQGDKNFNSFKNNLEEKADAYLLKPEIAGYTYFFNRPKSAGTLDLFFSLYPKGVTELLNMIRDFNPVLHFVTNIEKEVVTSRYGEAESEEDLRAVCMQKYYPQNFWDYIICRSKKINSSWWEDCLGPADAEKIKTCARNQEGIDLLKENSKLNKELNISYGPVYLLDNREIFSTNGIPSKEEFKKIIRR
jgi:hypothetical protein